MPESQRALCCLEGHFADHTLGDLIVTVGAMALHCALQSLRESGFVAVAHPVASPKVIRLEHLDGRGAGDSLLLADELSGVLHSHRVRVGRLVTASLESHFSGFFQVA